jgi:hypothetical protein
MPTEPWGEILQRLDYTILAGNVSVQVLYLLCVRLRRMTVYFSSSWRTVTTLYERRLSQGLTYEPFLHVLVLIIVNMYCFQPQFL